MPPRRIAGLAVAAWWWLGPRAGDGEPAPRKVHIVFLALDTLRADHIGISGPAARPPARTRETVMYIAMNRFRIARGREDVFEEMWRNRDSHLDGVPGFREFHLLRGPADEEATVFVSHSVWDSQTAFTAWTESEAFRRAHAQARAPEGTYLGHPRFEGFDVVL